MATGGADGADLVRYYCDLPCIDLAEWGLPSESVSSYLKVADYAQQRLEEHGMHHTGHLEQSRWYSIGHRMRYAGDGI